MEEYIPYFAGIIILFAAYLFHTSRNKTTTSAGTSKSSGTPYLDLYTIDFTARAKDGKVDIVVGREDEIQKLTRVLSRRNKNNALLVGAPGVGKTAIVEGLADKIVHEDIPPVLHGKRVLSLDVANLLSGTKYRGEFEERAKKIVHEITASNRSIILFIDELHTVIQSQGTEGSINFSDILKPALARGDLQLIGATTYNEYETYIKNDLSLERRFQPIEVPEPSVEETLAILKTTKDKFREYHKVEFTNAALNSAVKLTDKLIKDRKLPDKALDAIDEAGAMVRIAHLHPMVTPLLYHTAQQAHPEVVDIWTSIEALDKKISKNPHDKRNIAEREKLEAKLQNIGVITVDSSDIHNVIHEWIA